MDALGDGVFASLEAAFEAELVRTEDDAASDFAFNLLQDRDLVEALNRSGPRLLIAPGGTTWSLAEVGSNYVLGARDLVRVIVPIHLAVSSAAESGSPPLRAERTLLRLLREEARRGTEVEVELDGRTVRGTLDSAGKDHVVLIRRAAQTVIALGAIRSVTLPPLGSAGAL